MRVTEQIDATVADRVALLNEGSIVIEGTLNDLKRSPDPFVSKFIHESGEES